MNFGISNRINIPIIVFNILWSIIILFAFIFRIPEFENEIPDGASYAITGLLLITFFYFSNFSNLFFCS